MSVPICVIHCGNQQYVKDCIDVALKFNKCVYLLGDESNKMWSSEKIIHVPISSLQDNQNIATFQREFVNYSTNSGNFELVCFLRVMWLEKFLEKYNFDKVVHLDSDFMLLTDVENLLNSLKDDQIAYFQCKNYANPFRMSHTVHFSVLNRNFCQHFRKLCFDIYVNKTKFHLIEPKINYHRQNNVNGGICDMTLYYLISKNSDIKVYNLFEKVGDLMFDHNVSCSEGKESKDVYVMRNGIKKVTQDKDKFYFTKKDSNEYVRIGGLHFQGSKKSLISTFKSLIM